MGLAGAPGGGGDDNGARPTPDLNLKTRQS